MKTKNLLLAFTACLLVMLATGCIRKNKSPETRKVDARLSVALYQTDVNGTCNMQTPPLLEENIHISELIHYPNDGNNMTMPFHFSDINKYAEITANNLNKRIAICINGNVISTPVVKMEISDGGCSVLLNQEQVRQLFPKSE